MWKPGDPIPEGHGQIDTTPDGIYWRCKCGWKGRFLADLEDHYDWVTRGEQPFTPAS